MQSTGLVYVHVYPYVQDGQPWLNNLSYTVGGYVMVVKCRNGTWKLIWMKIFQDISWHESFLTRKTSTKFGIAPPGKEKFTVRNYEIIVV